MVEEKKIYKFIRQRISAAIDKDNSTSLTKVNDDTSNSTKWFSGKSLSRTENTRRRDKDRDEKVTSGKKSNICDIILPPDDRQ